MTEKSKKNRLNLKSKILAQPDIPQSASSPEIIKSRYRYWRIRIMYTLMIGYGAFYIARLNFSMAMPSFMEEFHLTTIDLGLVLSLFSIIYGVGKFVNGVLSDKSNPRYFMSLGLILTGIISIFLGFSTGFLMISFIWLLNAWAQSMGWPPCARSMTKWYSPQNRGFMWGIWNSSHQIGGIIALVLTGYLIQHFGWRAAFFIPGILVIFIAIFVANRLRDTPSSLGLPSLREHEPEFYKNSTATEKSSESVKEIFKKHILPNRQLWYLCFANFFVYIIRIGVLTWAPLFLLQSKGIDLIDAGWSTASFEFAGIFGALLAGYLSDRVSKGRRGPINVFFTMILIIGLSWLYFLPSHSTFLAMLVLSVVGFMVYGPQMLVGVAAADVSTANAAGTATGLTGTFGYTGAMVCNLMIGVIVANWGWDAGILFFICSGIAALLLFTLTWNARAR